MLKEKYIFIAGIVSLIISAFLIGNFITSFLIMFLGIGVISFIWVIKEKHKSRKIIIKFTSHSFALLSIIILAVILPYILFHKSFVSFYLITFVYFLPLIFIDAYLVPLYYEYLSEIKIDHKRLLKRSSIITVMMAVLIIGVYSFGGMLFVNNASDGLDSTIDVSKNSSFRDLSEENYDQRFNNFKVIQEIYLVDEEDIDKISTISFDEKSCLTEKCHIEFLDKLGLLMDTITRRGIRVNMLSVSMDEYSDVIKMNKEEIGMEVERMKTEIYSKEIPKNIELDFNNDEYDKLKVTINNLESDDDYEEVMPQVKAKFVGNSLFEKSSIYAFTHLKLYRSYIKTVSFIFGGEYRDYDFVFGTLYEGLEMDESIESKYLRCKIILDYEEMFLE